MASRHLGLIIPRKVDPTELSHRIGISVELWKSKDFFVEEQLDDVKNLVGTVE
jgi:hypothetical protein